ncbi:hypothetical protein AgCh_011077 [Apium graveolens]
MGNQLPCNFIKFRQVYGPSSNPWHVFPDDDQSWFFSPHLKDTEKCMFVFSKLSKVSRSNNSKKASSRKAGFVTSENTSKKAGCGTWDGKTTRKQIRDGEGNVVGEKRYLAFEINEIDSGLIGFDWSKIGFFKMHEYSLSGINAGLDSAHSIVLCKITYDSSKACTVNLKSGNRIAGNVIRTSGEAREKEEIMNHNLEVSCVIAENLTAINGGADNRSGANQSQEIEDTINMNLECPSSVTTENLNGIHGGVYEWFGATQFQELDAFSIEKEEAINTNVEGPSSVTTENLTGIHGGVDDRSRATQFQELDDIFGDSGFDDLGSEGFSWGDLGDIDPSFDIQGDVDDLGPCFDVDWIMRTLECDPQEGPVEDNSISNLGKRKFEADENLCMRSLHTEKLKIDVLSVFNSLFWFLNSLQSIHILVDRQGSATEIVNVVILSVLHKELIPLIFRTIIITVFLVSFLEKDSLLQRESQKQFEMKSSDGSSQARLPYASHTGSYHKIKVEQIADVLSDLTDLPTFLALLSGEGVRGCESVSGNAESAMAVDSRGGVNDGFRRIFQRCLV